MKSGFDANVPVRKPRTAIGRVLTELTTEPEADQPAAPDGTDGGRRSTARRRPARARRGRPAHPSAAPLR